MIKTKINNILKNIPKDTKFIFDLDKTLWNCTIEYIPDITEKYVYNNVNQDTKEILNSIQENNFSMNIASRSSEPEKCEIFLKYCFKDIYFDSINIFPTELYKTQHIHNIFNNEVPKKFIMFDDEKYILNNIKNDFDCKTIQCTSPLNYKIFSKLNY